MLPSEWSSIPVPGPFGVPGAPVDMSAFRAARSDDKMRPSPSGGEPEGPSDPQGEPSDLHRIFTDWVDSESKVLLMRFFHDNPGVVETLKGLASRLGVSPGAIERDLEDHVRLGVIKVVEATGRKVYVYNRKMAQELEHQVVRLLDRHQGENA